MKALEGCFSYITAGICVQIAAIRFFFERFPLFLRIATADSDCRLGRGPPLVMGRRPFRLSIPVRSRKGTPCARLPETTSSYEFGSASCCSPSPVELRSAPCSLIRRTPPASQNRSVANRKIRECSFRRRPLFILPPGQGRSSPRKLPVELRAAPCRLFAPLSPRSKAFHRARPTLTTGAIPRVRADSRTHRAKVDLSANVNFNELHQRL